MSTKIIATLGVRKTIFLSQLIIIARLGSYIFLSLGVYWALVGELLQGLCFGLFWSAAVKSISDKAPEEYQVFLLIQFKYTKECMFDNLNKRHQRKAFSVPSTVVRVQSLAISLVV